MSISPNDIGAICWTPDGSHVVFPIDHGRVVQVRRSTDLKLVQQFEKGPDGHGRQETMALLGDGKTLVSTPSAGSHGAALLGVWDIETGKLQQEIRADSGAVHGRTVRPPLSIRASTNSRTIFAITTEPKSSAPARNILLAVNALDWQVVDYASMGDIHIYDRPLCAGDSFVLGRAYEQPKTVDRDVYTSIFRYDLEQRQIVIKDRRPFLLSSMALHPSLEAVAMGRAAPTPSRFATTSEIYDQLADAIVIRDYNAQKDRQRVRCALDPVRDLAWSARGDFLFVQSYRADVAEALTYVAWSTTDKEIVATHTAPVSRFSDQWAVHPDRPAIAFADDSGLAVVELS